MRKRAILITGANGEIGHGLISSLHQKHEQNIIALDLQPMDPKITGYLKEGIVGNILDKNLLEQINGEYAITEIYHLAALLSTRAEFSPQMAHEVNVGGTINLLELAVKQSRSQGQAVKYFFPSSIAVYGFTSLNDKNLNPILKEDEYCDPQTMYGCNKLYCEKLGIYYSHHYQRLAAEFIPGLVDFRSIRFPGLISASTIPTGGTSDYAPEMIHAAVQGKPYSCFVRPDTVIPFMTMPDAIKSILSLMDADKQGLSRLVYNITAFHPSAKEFFNKILDYFPNADVDYVINKKRQAIVDSWPAEVDDSIARADWGWKPDYDFQSSFESYLIPKIKSHYGQ